MLYCNDPSDDNGFFRLSCQLKNWIDQILYKKFFLNCRCSRLPGGAQAPGHLDGGSNGIFVKAKTEMAAAVIRVLNTIELWKLSDSVERSGIENWRAEKFLKLD